MIERFPYQSIVTFGGCQEDFMLVVSRCFKSSRWSRSFDNWNLKTKYLQFAKEYWHLQFSAQPAVEVFLPLNVCSSQRRSRGSWRWPCWSRTTWTWWGRTCPRSQRGPPSIQDLCHGQDCRWLQIKTLIHGARGSLLRIANTAFLYQVANTKYIMPRVWAWQGPPNNKYKIHHLEY